jgi:hypothetical protein
MGSAGGLRRASAVLAVLQPADEHRQQRNHDDRHDHQRQILLNPGQVAEPVAGQGQRTDPAEAADQIEEP